MAPAVAVALAALVLNASPGDLLLLAQFLLASEILSLGLAWLALRLMRRLGRGGVQTKFAVTYALGVAIVLVNIILSSMLMFFSTHDAGLLIILLLFGGLVAIGFGQLMARSVTRGLDALAEASEAIAAGDLGRRVEVESEDEIEAVGSAFNAMAEKLDRAQRREAAALKAQRSLIASASHDLRTPLTSLRATVEALADGVVDEPEEVARYLAVAQADIAHLGRLVDDLFELTRLNAGVLTPRLEEGALGDLVSDTLQSMQVLAWQRKIEVGGTVDAHVDPVRMDSYLMQRALTNLVENALRHTPNGGRVWIAAQRDAEGVALAVCDTGEGIDPADLPHVFEAFFRGEAARSRERGEGAGLGLAIAKAIAEAHRGEISVRRGEEGRGTVVEIRLPPD